jgi:hypothetical protein
MPISALLLLVRSALLHASYYGFYKRSADKQVFVWCFPLIAVIIYSPVLILNWPVIPAPGWLCLLLSGLMDSLSYGYLTLLFILLPFMPYILLTEYKAHLVAEWRVSKLGIGMAFELCELRGLGAQRERDLWSIAGRPPSERALQRCQGPGLLSGLRRRTAGRGG